jgi:hypothetical protein
VAKDAQGRSELKNDSRQPRGLLKNRHGEDLKKNQLALSQGMLKTGDADDDEVDDEVRTTVPSQNCATETLRTEKSFLRTHYLKLSPISAERCGGGAEK